MYYLSLEIVNQCNLNCTYCYLGKKKNRIMSEETAKKSITMAVHEAMKQHDKSLLVYFIGGEPLLAFNLLRFCTDYTKMMCDKNNLKALFSTTINGTQLNQEITDFFIKCNFDLKISIDGTKASHDRNRKYYDRKGSYDQICHNLQYIWEYESKTKKICHSAQVITSNNCSSFFNNICHLSELGFQVVESGIDIYGSWTERDLKILYRQFEVAFDYYKELKRKETKISWKFFEDRIQNLVTNVHFYGCKAGLASIYVNTEGDFYPCTELDDNIKIGNVNAGLDVNKIRKFVGLNCSTNPTCLNCKELMHCKAAGCIMNNYEVNNNFFKPVGISCEVTKFILSMLRTKLSLKQQEAFKRYYWKEEKIHG